MSLKAKTIWKTLGLILLAGIGYCVFGFCLAWRRFAAEERVCGAFHSVVDALHNFRDDTGALATNLAQLTPKYIDGIPKVSGGSVLEYSLLADGTNWQLSAHGIRAGKACLYVLRPSQIFSSNEESRAWTSFHGVRVFHE